MLQSQTQGNLLQNRSKQLGFVEDMEVISGQNPGYFLCTQIQELRSVDERVSKASVYVQKQVY